MLQRPRRNRWGGTLTANIKNAVGRIKKTKIRHEKLPIMALAEVNAIIGKYRPCPMGTVNTINRISLLYDLHIIIPVYNNDRYLKECLTSVLQQKTKYSFYVTVVDDGSTDRTAEIADEFAHLQNIQVIHQENRGFSGARNRALECILGRYIAFVDSDDKMTENAVEKILDTAYKTEADIVEGAAYKITETGKVYGIIKSENYFGNPQNIQLRGMPWGKIYRAELWKNMKFPEGYLFEDSINGYCVYPNANKKYAISDIVYEYRRNPKGISLSSLNDLRALDTFWITEYLWNWMIENKQPIDRNTVVRMIDQLRLNCRRTVALPEEAQKAGFLKMCILVENVMPIFAKHYLEEADKAFLQTFLNKDYGEYRYRSNG